MTDFGYETNDDASHAFVDVTVHVGEAARSRTLLEVPPAPPATPPPAPVDDEPAPSLVVERAPPTADEQRSPRARLRVSKSDRTAILGRGLTLFGIVVALYLGYALFVTSLEHGRDQRSRVARFALSLEHQEAPIGGVISEGTPVALIEIPRLGVRQAVVEGTTSSLLRGGPGHLRNSPLPGQPGNSVIAARRALYGGPFRRLDQLTKGDQIKVTTGQGHAVYVVSEVGRVRRDEDDPISATNDNRLTLVTSAPLFVATDRLAAVAKLDTAPVAAPAPRVNQIRSDELGLQGDGTSVFALLVWAQVLLVGICIALWYALRWARWPTYLLAVPVLALLLLLLFDSFTPLLPSTL